MLQLPELDYFTRNASKFKKLGKQCRVEDFLDFAMSIPERSQFSKTPRLTPLQHISSLLSSPILNDTLLRVIIMIS